MAVRDPAGAPLFAFKSERACQFEIASTSRGVCTLFFFRKGDPGVLACGDLHDPDPLVELTECGFMVGKTNELVMVHEGLGQRVFIVDLSDDSVSETTAPGSFSDATAAGRDAFALYLASDPRRGIIFRWDGATGYEMVWDPLPFGVVNVHAADGQLVWTEGELSGTKTGASIYRAPWPPTGATIAPTLVRKIEVPAMTDWSALGGGQIAFHMTNRIELVDLADAARHTVSMTDRWQATGRHVTINARSLVVQMFDKADTDQNVVTFRAKLSDVLALPAD